MLAAPRLSFDKDEDVPGAFLPRGRISAIGCDAVFEVCHLSRAPRVGKRGRRGRFPVYRISASRSSRAAEYVNFSSAFWEAVSQMLTPQSATACLDNYSIRPPLCVAVGSR